MEAEMGDVLFSIINAARLYGIHPENALERTNKKFISRFNYMEQHAREDGKKFSDMTLDEMEAYWQAAKQTEA
jgi:XTP/dITP diphosphohydrolase